MTESLRRSGRVSEARERSAVTVSTPNEQVFGEVRGQREVRIWFAPGHYQRVTTARLQDELGALARLLFAAGLKDANRVFRQVTGRDAVRRSPVSPGDVEYDRRLREMEASGESDDGSVRVTAIGQPNHSVQIVAGAPDRVSQEQFEASCAQAANRLIADTEQQAARAKWEIFDPLPGLSL